VQPGFAASYQHSHNIGAQPPRTKRHIPCRLSREESRQDPSTTTTTTSGSSTLAQGRCWPLPVPATGSTRPCVKRHGAHPHACSPRLAAPAPPHTTSCARPHPHCCCCCSRWRKALQHRAHTEGCAGPGRLATYQLLRAGGVLKEHPSVKALCRGRGTTCAPSPPN